jgi:hypothetical protein
MKLPNEFKLQHVHHRHGGRITRITEIKHETAKPKGGRSQDTWFFVGDVEWDDGTKSLNTEIAPWALAQDGDAGHQEISGLLRAMNTYLAANGQWCHESSRHEGWYANERK